MLLKTLILAASFMGNDTIPSFYKVEERVGLIIFPKTDSIPQDAIFIPVKNMSSLSFDDLLTRGLQENDKRASVIYFQGMRWRFPDLAELIKGCYQTTGILKVDRRFFGDISEVQIVLATLTFDKTVQGEVFPDPLTDDVELQYNGRSYFFTIYEAMSSDEGAPIIFKKIEVN